MPRRLLLLALLLTCCRLGAQDLNSVRELKQLWKYDEAIASLTQMLEEQGPQPVLLEELADCYYQNGNVAGALDLYTQLDEIQPDKLLYKLRLMGLLNRGQQYAAVITIGRSVLQRDSIAQVAVMVGDAFNKLERRDSAEWYYRRVLARRPHNESVLNKLSNILLGQERFGEVRVLAEDFLAEEPDNLTILPIAGLSYYFLEEYNKAYDTFEKANRLGDDSYAVHYYLGKCAQKFGIRDAEEREFTLAWERDSTDVSVALTIARAKADLNRPDWETWYGKALDMLLPSPKLLETTGSAYQNYAHSAYMKGRFDSCIELYKKVLEYRPKYYAAYYMIAQCYEYKYDYQNALNWFKKAQKVFAEGTRGREIADAGAERVQAELFMIGD